ncbi:MAG TPA: recombinase RecT [Tepidisphaeraceae bacterium]|jgi:hypothetical protein
MLLFRIAGKNVEPLAPASVDIDNVTVFDLAGAAAKTRRSEKSLTALWVGKWGDVLPAEQITGEPLGDPMKRPAVVKRAALVLTDEQRDELLRVMLYPQLPPEAWAAFKVVAEQRRLSIYSRHLHPEYRYDGSADAMKLVIITSIEAVRLLARRSDKCRGRADIEWAGEDRVWVKEWDSEEGPPKWARCAVNREGDYEPTRQVVEWSAYAPYVDTANGPEVDPFWLQNSAMMLGKVAEVAAYRALFPEELEGIYTGDEMRQADNFQPSARPSVTKPRVDPDSQAYGGEDSQVEEFIDQEEFADLLAAAVPDEAHREAALRTYKIKYRRLWQVQAPQFYVMVAKDLRELIRQRSAA